MSIDIRMSMSIDPNSPIIPPASDEFWCMERDLGTGERYPTCTAKIREATVEMEIQTIEKIRADEIRARATVANKSEKTRAATLGWLKRV